MNEEKRQALIEKLKNSIPAEDSGHVFDNDGVTVLKIALASLEAPQAKKVKLPGVEEKRWYNHSGNFRAEAFGTSAETLQQYVHSINGLEGRRYKCFGGLRKRRGKRLYRPEGSALRVQAVK